MPTMDILHDEMLKALPLNQEQGQDPSTITLLLYTWKGPTVTKLTIS